MKKSLKKVLRSLSNEVYVLKVQIDELRLSMQTELRVLAENSESVAKEVTTLNTDFKNVAINYSEGVSMEVEIEYLKEKLSRYEEGWTKDIAEEKVSLTDEELETQINYHTNNIHKIIRNGSNTLKQKYEELGILEFGKVK